MKKIFMLLGFFLFVYNLQAQFILQEGERKIVIVSNTGISYSESFVLTPFNAEILSEGLETFGTKDFSPSFWLSQFTDELVIITIKDVDRDGDVDLLFTITDEGMHNQVLWLNLKGTPYEKDTYCLIEGQEVCHYVFDCKPLEINQL